MRHSDQSGRWYRFFRETKGHAMVEQALFLALVAGCVVVAADSVGILSGGVFGDVGQTLGEAPVATRQAKSHGNAQQIAGDGVPIDQPVVATTRPVSQWRFIAVSAVLIVGVGTWVLLYRRGLSQITTVAEEIELPEGWNPESLFRKRQQVLRIISEDMDSLFESRLTIRHLMSTRVKTILPTMLEDEAYSLMEKEKIRHLIVCRDDGALIGIISNRDILPDGRRRISQLMTSDPHTVSADSLVSPAMTTLMNWRISCLPVVDDDKVLGVITTTDLMMALQVTLQMMQKVAKQVSIGTGESQESELVGSIAE